MDAVTMVNPPSPQASRVALVANTLLVIFWAINAVLWGQMFALLEVIVAAACVLCAWGVWHKARWGYFLAAALAFGLMRLAMDKYSGVYEDEVKSLARGVYVLVVPWAIWLHEAVAQKTPPPSD